MTTKKKATRAKTEPISTIEIGRYLKRLSVLNKDRNTGNPALSVALQELATLLMTSKEQTIRQVFASNQKQIELNLDKPLPRDNATLTLPEISAILEAPEETRTSLIALGSDRFGIPASKMAKSSKEEVARSIRSALEHEQSIEILSDEASRGGQSRKS